MSKNELVYIASGIIIGFLIGFMTYDALVNFEVV